MQGLSRGNQFFLPLLRPLEEASSDPIILGSCSISPVGYLVLMDQVGEGAMTGVRGDQPAQHGLKTHLDRSPCCFNKSGIH